MFCIYLQEIKRSAPCSQQNFWQSCLNAHSQALASITDVLKWVKRKDCSVWDPAEVIQAICKTLCNAYKHPGALVGLCWCCWEHPMPCCRPHLGNVGTGIFLGSLVCFCAGSEEKPEQNQQMVWTQKWIIASCSTWCVPLHSFVWLSYLLQTLKEDFIHLQWKRRIKGFFCDLYLIAWVLPKQNLRCLTLCGPCLYLWAL